MKNAELYGKMIKRGVLPVAALAAAYMIAPWEGLVNPPYHDVVGIKTVCFGYTGSDIQDRVYTDDECIDLLAKETLEARKYVLTNVTVEFASDYQQAALISFVYNVGVGNFMSSTLVRKINEEDHEGACNELTRWVYAGGKKYQGLVNRRQHEMEFCLGNITVEEYEEHLRQIKEQSNKELEEGVSYLQCMVPPYKLSYSCQYGGVFCPPLYCGYVINNSHHDLGSYFRTDGGNW